MLDFYFVTNAAKLNLHSDVTFIFFSEVCSGQVILATVLQ